MKSATQKALVGALAGLVLLLAPPAWAGETSTVTADFLGGDLDGIGAAGKNTVADDELNEERTRNV